MMKRLRSIPPCFHLKLHCTLISRGLSPEPKWHQPLLKSNRSGSLCFCVLYGSFRTKSVPLLVCATALLTRVCQISPLHYGPHNHLYIYVGCPKITFRDQGWCVMGMSFWIAIVYELLTRFCQISPLHNTMEPMIIYIYYVQWSSLMCMSLRMAIRSLWMDTPYSVTLLLVWKKVSLPKFALVKVCITYAGLILYSSFSI